ncbi:MAG: NAD(P)/FAD-dependent oxidoreductase [Pseudomonadota bacterium]
MTTRRAFLAGSSAAIVAGIAPRMAWGRTETDVAIIGAGLAGLSAARICEAAGLSVTVIEGSDRIGGRLYTLDDMPGAPEAGGIQVGAGYVRLHAMARELGVDLSSNEGQGAGRRQTPGNLYWVGGERIAPEAWPKNSANLLSEKERGTEPAALLRRYASALPKLQQPQDWLTASRDLDISVRQSLSAAGASAEALRLIEANFNGNSLAEMSALHLARTFTIYRSQPGPISTITGGSQRLPEAMARSLSSAIRLKEPVQAIREEADGVSLRLSDQTMRARQVICTIPFSALRDVPVQGNFIDELRQMTLSLPYTRASFAYLTAKEPFWQDDPYPDTLWTDDPLIGRVFVLSDGSGGGPPMLKLWTNGTGADLFDRMPQETLETEIIKRIERARPSARGKLKVARLFSWQKVSGARGIYHHIGTGMAGYLATACKHQSSNLHFAGEHLAIANSGMEGAIESGERAAMRVLERT